MQYSRSLEIPGTLFGSLWRSLFVCLHWQPVLSASILDHVIHHDKKFPAEFITAENCIEMQVRTIKNKVMTVSSTLLSQNLDQAPSSLHILLSMSFLCFPQSLQIASFLMTVCNVVVVMIDWFADINIFRYGSDWLVVQVSPPASIDSAMIVRYTRCRTGASHFPVWWWVVLFAGFCRLPRCSSHRHLPQLTMGKRPKSTIHK